VSARAIAPGKNLGDSTRQPLGSGAGVHPDGGAPAKFGSLMPGGGRDDPPIEAPIRLRALEGKQRGSDTVGGGVERGTYLAVW
jgi:hypothetical protein